MSENEDGLLLHDFLHTSVSLPMLVIAIIALVGLFASYIWYRRWSGRLVDRFSAKGPSSSHRYNDVYKFLLRALPLVLVMLILTAIVPQLHFMTIFIGTVVCGMAVMTITLHFIDRP